MTINVNQLIAAAKSGLSDEEKVGLLNLAANLLSCPSPAIDAEIQRLSYKPELDTMLTISISHLPLEAEQPRWLSDQPNMMVYAEEYGWIIQVPLHWSEADLPDNEFPHPAINAIWCRAEKLGARWVRLDSAGPVDPNLLTYE